MSNRLTPWSIHDSADLYQVDRWGRDFFSISHEGEVVVHPDAGHAQRISLPDVVRQCARRGIYPPMLIRFPGIIRQRLKQLNGAFDRAIDDFGYAGRYRSLYPVKVNQHYEVIEAFLQAGKPYECGLEAGSKAELLAIIAMADDETTLLCNGFKDDTVIEVAMRAVQLGRNLTIVIEKPTDIPLIAEMVQKYGVAPRLGIRVKLAARGFGRWQSSGGHRSKFGLTATELVTGIEQLRAHGLLERCQLLHFHPGSQINNVRHIKAALIEATRIYADLVRQGVPLKTIDVGGGLAVDYTGNQNTEPSSMNYTLQEYANDVVYYIQMVCDQMGVAHPDILSESGRALVAHHSMLVVPVIGTSQTHAANARNGSATDVDPDIPLLVELKGILAELNQKNVLESYHDAQQAMETVQQLFANGHMTLNQRAAAEGLFWSVCHRSHGLLDALDFVPKELEELRELFADTYFANFSVFQSLPDYWAIDQLFPMMPIHRLHERPSRHGVVGDITCDSDGQVNCFLGSSKTRKSLPLHALEQDQPYWLGIFLVGAYQEALSDDHNLMGKFHVVIVDHESGDGQLRIQPGSSLREVLEHVHHDFDAMLGSIQNAANQAVTRKKLSRKEARQIVQFFRSAAGDYTYLVDDDKLGLNDNGAHESAAADEANGARRAEDPAVTAGSATG